ncbi:sialate O-acetylesterase [Roseiconus lacunae]|uniref:sialate O-acetylesterase n=1 Tax=Roseiconus lacunae TaxID=2605694 RepID=UPI001E5FF53B|nr:sialate O-acetylesterase [Roseiconus lacunae]MCD0462942.1 sialate O-acetylesterase [Roseiconus lacunae]
MLRTPFHRSANVIRRGGLMLLAIVGPALCFFDAVHAGERKPLKVFVLAGQSNMQGHAHVRTFDAMRLNDQAAPLLEKMLDADGEPVVCQDVWISSIGSSEIEQHGRLTIGYGAERGGPKIGPEFTFGIYLHQTLKEPILLIKTAWGGKSLNTDFRPPGVEPYQFNEQQLELFQRQDKDIEELKTAKLAASGQYYQRMIEHVQHVLKDIRRVYPDYDPEQGYDLAGFVWFQGWNDMVDRGTYPNRDQPGGYAEYSRLLAQFIRDVRTDLQTPELPVVIGVLGGGGPTELYGPDQQRYRSTHQEFRQAMAAPAKMDEFDQTVVAVLTERYWDQEVVRLRQKEKTIKPRIDELKTQTNAGDLSRQASLQAIESLYKNTFSEEELTRLRESVSNGDYHYMGSASILAPIGKAFADAMATLVTKSQSSTKSN